MDKHKRIRSFIIALMLFSLGAAAQNDSRSLDSLAATEASHLTRVLSLTSDQAVRLQQATKANLEVLDSMSHLSISDAERKLTNGTEEKQYRNKVKSILTAEQFARYMELINQKKAIFKTHTEQKKRLTQEINE